MKGSLTVRSIELLGLRIAVQRGSVLMRKIGVLKT